MRAGGGRARGRGAAAAGGLALLLAGVTAAGAAPEAWEGAAGEDLQTVPVALPGGGTVDIHFWGTPRVLPERIPGILDFELFPAADAQLLVDVAERWAVHDRGGGGTKEERYSGWSNRPDDVDSQPEWQINLIPPYAGENTTVPRRGPNRGLKSALLPLTKRICLGMLPEFLGKHRVAKDECNSLFLRKYEANNRPTIPTHQDSTVFTLNVALSDYRKVQGGELFACQQIPQSWARLLVTQQNLLPDGKPAPEGEEGEEGSKTFWQPSKWFSLLYPYSRIARSTPENQGACMKAQGAQGHAVSAFGGRLHGVFPTESGTRYSLIIFIGEPRDIQLPEDYNNVDKRVKSWLAEPFREDHVTKMSESDMMSWLIHLSGISTRIGRGQMDFQWYKQLLLELQHDGVTLVYAIRDLVIVLKHFADNADLSSLALRSMHAMLVGQEMPHDEFRGVALEAGAEEHVLRAIASHPERFDVGQLGCAVWESLRCGGLEGEECQGRPVECEDGELWGPLEIDEAMHGTRPFEQEDWERLVEECVDQAQRLEEEAAALDPDCFLLYAIQQSTPPEEEEEEEETRQGDGEL